MLSIDEKATARINGHDMAYYRAGNGETVLLVHGITTYSFIWRNVFPLLARDHDVIAVDLLGCGDSAKPLDTSYAIKAHAELLHDFMIALGVDRFHFVGHDLGGGMGQIFAVNHPERLLDLTLINTIGYDFWPVQPITALRTPIIRQLLMASLDKGTFRQIVKRGVHNKENVTPELMRLFMKPLETREGRKAFLHLVRCLDNHNLMEIEADLRRLSLPVLIIRGQEDPYLNREISERLNRDIPGSVLKILPGSGHFIQEDAPREIVDAIITHFEGRHDDRS